MWHQWNYLLFFVYFAWKSIPVSSYPEPGTIYYRKPTKLVFYKKYPPVLIYPKDSDDLKFFGPNNRHVEDHGYGVNLGQSIIGTKHNKNVYSNSPGFLEHLVQNEGKYHLRKVEMKPFYENWLSWLLGFKNEEEQHTTKELSLNIGPDTAYTHYEDTNYHNEPIYSHHPIKALNTVSPLHQYYEFAQNPKTHHVDDIKPVEEHIEGDIKYDFRTKIHSFGNN